MRRTAERTTLSPMTRTVTVAPLTMSTWGGRSAPGRNRLHVLADEGVHRIDDAALGNADEDDGFLMVDELDPGDDAVRIDADQQVDRLAGIADGIGEIGVEVNVPQQAGALVRGNERRIALRWAEAVGSGEELGGLCLREKLLDPSCGKNRVRSQQEHQSSKERQKPAKSAELSAAMTEVAGNAIFSTGDRPERQWF